MPFRLGGTTVRFDNIPAPLDSVSDTEILCFSPFEITDHTTVQVESNGVFSNPVRVGVPESDIQIVAVSNEDGSPNSADHPAKPGSVLIFYVSGLGLTRPLSSDGLLNSPPLAVPIVPVTVYFGSPVQPEFVGAAPGEPAGKTQINVRLPLADVSPSTIRINTVAMPIYVAH